MGVKMMGKGIQHGYRYGFTVVELLIVIVVIAILAALTLVAFNGIQQRARIVAIQSDLRQAADQLEIYRNSSSSTDQYPPDQATAALKAGSGTVLNYQVSNVSPPSYCLTAVNGNLNYKVTSANSTPVQGACSGVLASGTSCPSGFIVVPGNSTFGTSEFCVMKYEAKQASATVPISQAAGTPWVSITQTSAASHSANVPGCIGCHLITEAEWLTIAHNVLNVASNWSSGTIGNGYIFSGHNDGAPSGPVPASTDDEDSYSYIAGSGANQRRILTLSNGEVIWDMAGNANEWTSGTIAAGQQPGSSGDTGYSWREWNNGTLLLHGLPPFERPSYGTTTASAWTSAQGIGQIFSYYNETVTHPIFRGGNWNAGANAGVMTLNLDVSSSYIGTGLGFRVAR